MTKKKPPTPAKDEPILNIVRNLDECRCEDPRQAHKAFTYGRFNSGEAHYPQEIIETRKLRRTDEDVQDVPTGRPIGDPR